MSKTVYNIDFTRLLPDSLKNDETMLALGCSIARALQMNIVQARNAAIYPRINELDEQTLDILARDFHVDWYNDAYPIDVKRSVIKNSVKVHKRLGTKFAVITAIGDIFPNSEVQEWFEYGGTHHRFRIILDLSNAKAPLNLSQIIKAAKFYKRFSAHLEEVVYQMSAVIELCVETEIYRFHTGVTGINSKTGTHPQRTVKGGATSAEIEVLSSVSGNKFKSDYAGTKPERSTGFSDNSKSVFANVKAEAFLYTSSAAGSGNVGTKPHANVKGQKSGGGLIPTVNAELFFYRVKRCGTSRCGGNL